MPQTRKGENPTLNKLEDLWEHFFYSVRWALVPAYMILILCLIVLIAKTAQSFWKTVLNFINLTETETIVRILSIVDIVLVINLLLMIIFVGYTNFVSKIDDQRKLRDKPGWMETLGYSGLKVQLLGSILAISSVKLLSYSIELDQSGSIDEKKFIWLIAIQMTFVVSVVCLAITNRLKVIDEGDKKGSPLTGLKAMVRRKEKPRTSDV